MNDNIKTEATQRGFMRGEFKDANGVECSIQESSAIPREEDGALIWLGPNKIEMKHFKAGQGWRDMPEFDKFSHEEHYVSNTRMHLTQADVKALLPVLQFFAEHGELP